MGADGFCARNALVDGDTEGDAFAGAIPYDPRGGYLYGLQAQGANLKSIVTGRQTGFDLRWSTPLRGLTVGTSLAYSDRSFNATLGPSPVLFSYWTKLERVTAYYGEYTHGNFRANGEYRRQTRRADVTVEVPAHRPAPNRA